MASIFDYVMHESNENDSTLSPSDMSVAFLFATFLSFCIVWISSLASFILFFCRKMKFLSFQNLNFKFPKKKKKLQQRTF